MSDLRVLASLGILISGGRQDALLPEEVLVSGFELAKDDYKALVLLHTWVQSNHDLIHIEALLSVLKRRELSGVSRLIAGSLLATGDKRFDRFFKFAKNDGIPKLGKYISFAAEIGQSPADPSFLEFGLKVSRIELEHERKFRPRRSLLELNPFFFCRTFFGVNWRADIAACLLIANLKNPTEVSKFLGCSYDAAYRNYRDLSSVGWNKKTARAFALKAV